MVYKVKEWLSTYTLGTVFDSKVNFNTNTDFIHKRCQPRIFCLQKLRSFYRSCIELVLTFLFLCQFGGLNVKSENVLNKVVNVCGKVVGERQEHWSQLYERRVVRKARVIVDDNSHVLAKRYELLPSGRWFHVPKSNTVQSIAFLNSVCVWVYVHVWVYVCKLRKLLVCFLCNFCIFNNCSLNFKI